MKPRDAADALGVSYPTLKQWIYGHKIVAHKTPGGHYRIPESEIARLHGVARGAVHEVERISGRNQLRGTILSIRREGLLAAVTLAIAEEQRVQAVITAEAAESLALAPGMEATALIKATEVMVMR